MLSKSMGTVYEPPCPLGVGRLEDLVFDADADFAAATNAACLATALMRRIINHVAIRIARRTTIAAAMMPTRAPVERPVLGAEVAATLGTAVIEAVIFATAAEVVGVGCGTDALKTVAETVVIVVVSAFESVVVKVTGKKPVW
jgi:hypothetical protein